MKVFIIGGVAAGTKVAAKLKREDRSAEVTIITKGKNISYAGCGLPYYVGHVIEDKNDLIVNSPESFEKLTDVKVITGTEVTNVDVEAKRITAVADETGETSSYTYDKLVIASGASPIIPEVEGVDLKNVFVMRTPEDAIELRAAVDAGEIKRAVVVGAGFIGLEVAENLKAQGVRVTVIDLASHVLSNLFDSEICEYLETKMAEAGVMAMTGVSFEGITGEGKVEKVITSKRAIKSDAVILAMGIRANTEFLVDSGIEMEKGVILTDADLQTNIKDVYAVGDCAYVANRLTEKKTWSPMGSTANIAGRVLAQNMVGNAQDYLGVLGTGIAKLPGDINVSRTGLTEAAAKEMGYQVEVITVAEDDKAHYYKGAGVMIIKLVADKESKKVLGVQVIGTDAVDKVTDIIVTGISLGATVEQLQNLDFAYAPPFSTAIHPLSHALNVLTNKMGGKFVSITPAEFAELDLAQYKVLDVSKTPAIAGADYVELDTINADYNKYGKEEKLLLVCTKGRRAYLAQNRLDYYGYKETVVLEAGTTFTEVNL